MSFLARLEEACAAFVERVFATTFPSEVQPAEVARKMAAALEAYALGERGTRTPRLFVVRVAGGDFERLAPYRAELAERWRELVEEMAATLGTPLRERPEVRLLADPLAAPGTVNVELEGEAGTPTRVLVVRRGLPAGGRLPLDRGGTIGRDASCDLVLLDPRVSRRHARAECAGGAWEIIDLQSRNGTVVDGQRVDRAPLQLGSLVELGDTLLAVEEAPSRP
ncbi:DUF2662 domain-containing protein [bacterium]|nr:MAG: DUF2662 domain-containing protein [bacterium]